MTARFSAQVDPGWDLHAWRSAARHALQAQIAPEQLDWLADSHTGLLAAPDVMQAIPTARIEARVPRDFLALAARVLCHRDPDRHALLYRMLWRLAHGEPHLLQVRTDRDVHRAETLAKQVNRDSHKMKAFVRFREVAARPDHYVAWFEPDHQVVDHVAPFFARRFPSMLWAILTPYRSVHWEGEQLQFGAGAKRSDAPGDDATEDLWRLYYANIFNPARLNPKMMEREMPRRYWGNLPETHQLPSLLRDAGKRVHDMAEREAQAPRRRIVPRAQATPDTGEPPSARAPADLDAALHACRNCELWRDATQVVPGAGPRDARIMLVGEQPGDHEDITGRVFVGPAGQLFDAILAELGQPRAQLYITNAVKHFHHRPLRKQRLHQTPKPEHIRACRPWLELEVARLRPELIITLGAVALRALTGHRLKLADVRGSAFAFGNATLFATVHPAWVLRQPIADRQAARQLLLEDLQRAFSLSLLPPPKSGDGGNAGLP